MWALDASAAAAGICDVHEGRVDEYGKLAPRDWPAEAGYTRGSAISRRKEQKKARELERESQQQHDYYGVGGSGYYEPNTSATSHVKDGAAPSAVSGYSSNSSNFKIPRGVARSIEREGIRQSQVHEIALRKRRDETKVHGRWLQGKNPNNSHASSLYTQYSEGGSIMDPSVLRKRRMKKNDNKGDFNGRTSTYGELASQYLELSGGPRNPFRNSAMGGGVGSEVSVGSAGSISVVQSTSSHANKNRSELIQAVAKSVKSHRLTSSFKIKTLAEFGEVLVTAPNNLPGHAAVTELAKRLVDTASSNPNPEIISRNQFVRVVMSNLEHIDLQVRREIRGEGGRGEDEKG